jgi:annexin A7/11
MSNPYENLFGKDKKQQNTGPNQQYGQNQNNYGQYPNQQQPYGQNQPPYGQYPNQPPYAQNQPPYGQNQPPYGQNQPPYGQNQPPYGQNQPPYGQNQPPYGQNQQQYGQNQPPYGQNQQQYGQNQPPYGQNQPPYGQNQPPYGQNQPPYGQNQPPYGQNQPPYGQNQSPYGQNQPSQGKDQLLYGHNQPDRQNTYQQQPYGQNNNYQQYNQNQQPPQSSKTQLPNNQPPSQYGQNTQQQQYPNLYGQTQTYSQNQNQNNSPYNINLNRNNQPIDQVKVDKDAAALRQAMKGFGTDEKAIIKICGNSKNRERLAMIDSFKRQFNRDLIKDLKSELSGNMENATIALFQDPITYDCFSLNKAMKGLGTNEDTLIEILCTRTNKEINEIKQKYARLYSKSLDQQLSSELSGDLKKVMLTLASATRSENPNPDKGECLDKADRLYKAGEKRLGTDEKVFYDILTRASPQELVLIDKIYKENYKHGLLKAIDNEFSGNMKKLLRTIVFCSIDPAEYFASRVNYAIKGIGTKDTLLIRILVTRAEIDLPDIRAAYRRMYNKDMIADIESDTSGYYQKLLVEICSH